MAELDITPTKLCMREKTGERTDGNIDKYAPTYIDAHINDDNDESVCVPMCVYNKDLMPDNPIPDKRIEMFLDAIVENDAHSTSDYYELFKKHLTPITGRKEIDKANMRKLMMAPAVRARLKFLRDAEWELNRPHLQTISREFERLIDNEDLTPRDKIAALNSLAKVAGVIENNSSQQTTGQVSITFNMAEKPKTPATINAEIVS